MKVFIITASRGLQKAEELVLAYSILGIALLTVANVTIRGMFNTSLSFAEEISQFFIIAVTFVGLSYAARKHRHIRMTALSDQLSIPMRRKLMIGITFGTSLLMLLLCGYSIRYVLAVYQLGGVYPVTRVPIFIVYLVAPFGFALAGIHYAKFCWLIAEGSLTVEEISNSEEALPSTRI